MPYEETLGAYREADRRQGKVRYVGCLQSRRRPAARGARRSASQKKLPRYEVLQPEYNLYDRVELRRAAARPLHRGRDRRHHLFQPRQGLSVRQIPQRGRSRQKPARRRHAANISTRAARRILAALDAVSARHGAKPAEVALAWVMARPGVTAPIASATTIEQVDSLVRAANLELTRRRHQGTRPGQRVATLARAAGCCQRAELPAAASPPSAAGAAGSGAARLRPAAASQAASVSAISRRMNSSLSRPGGIGGRKRALIVPG